MVQVSRLCCLCSVFLLCFLLFLVFPGLAWFFLQVCTYIFLMSPQAHWCFEGPGAVVALVFESFPLSHILAVGESPDMIELPYRRSERSVAVEACIFPFFSLAVFHLVGRVLACFLRGVFEHEFVQLRHVVSVQFHFF